MTSIILRSDLIQKPGLLLLWLLFWLAISAPAAVFADNQQGTVITSLVVNRVNIYSAEEAGTNVAYRLLNSAHRTTREQTIVRELGVQPGDVLQRKDVEALERHLRRMDLFASVVVQLITEGDTAGTLIVNTRDRLSIVAGADGSFTGGVGEVGVTLGERNLFGYGDNVSLSLRRNTADELRGVFSYRDLHWLNARQSALYRVGATEEGEFLQLRFSRPFKYPADRTSWTTQIESVGQEIDYYEDGLSVVQVPQQRHVLSGNSLWRQVKSGITTRRGISVLLGNYTYDPVTGSQAASIDQPENNTQLLVSSVLGRARQSQHRKVTGLDTLRFIQDIRFGWSSELRIGARFRVNESGDTSLLPVVSGSLAGSRQLHRHGFAKLTAGFSAELVEQGASTTAALGAKYFRQFTPQMTFATRVDYRQADTDGELPVQYTLGEANGLRGYANRLLSGDKMLRVNIEQRYDLQRKVGFLDVGLIGFVDAGWVTPESDRLRRAAGVGLRLGSTALLGRAVIRLDVAYPFDVDDPAPVYSAALGQVFTF